jgi:hypothetical protein
MLYITIYFLVICVHVSTTTKLLNGKHQDDAFFQKVKIPNKFFYNDYRYSRLLETLLEQEKNASIKHMEENNQLQLKEERENEIFLKKLASKVQSSFLKDFHTLRY